MNNKNKTISFKYLNLPIFSLMLGFSILCALYGLATFDGSVSELIQWSILLSVIIHMIGINFSSYLIQNKITLEFILLMSMLYSVICCLMIIMFRRFL